MNNKTNREKTLELYPDNAELFLLDMLSHYLQNNKKGFRTKVKNTYVLNPHGSDLFPIDIQDEGTKGMPYVGVPTKIFDVLMKLRMYNFNVINDTPGLFMMFAVGVGKDTKPCALRIHKRSKQTTAIGRYKFIKLVRIDDGGKILGNDKKNVIKLPLKSIRGVDW